MQKMLVVLFALSLAACDGIKKGSLNPAAPSSDLVAPSGAPVTSSSPKVIIELGVPTNRQPNKYAVTFRGEGGARDLIDGLPLRQGESFNTTAGEKWSGTNIRVIDWANSSAGVLAQTSIPFEPGTNDMFFVPALPPLAYPNAKEAKVDFTIQLIPGGQIENGQLRTNNLHIIDVMPNEGNVRVVAPNKPDFKVRFETDDKGRVHIKSDTLPF